jgi:hypothetical protein
MQKLRTVVLRLLARGRAGHEEARVEPAGTPRLRDPPAQVGELVGREREMAFAQKVGQRELALRERAPPPGELRAARIAFDRDERPAALVREQQSRFLAALANGRDPVGEAAFPHAQGAARPRVVHALSKQRERQVAVGVVHGAAREDVGAAREFGEMRAPHHQHLGTALAVAQEGECRRRAGNQGLGHEPTIVTQE